MRLRSQIKKPSGQCHLYTGSPESNVVHDVMQYLISFVPARPWLEIDTMLGYIVHQNIAYFVVINVSI